jgi:hypothetical protein
MRCLYIPTNQIKPIDFESIRDGIVRTFFPFTLSESNKNLSDEILMKYEISAKLVKKELDMVTELKANMENTKLDKEYKLNVLNQLKEKLSES